MFTVHGQWQIDITPPNVFVNLVGAFNCEGMTALEQEARRMWRKYDPGQLYCAVINLSEFEMTTVDSIDALKDYFVDMERRGYRRIDYIGINALSRKIISELCSQSDIQVQLYLDVATYLSQHPTNRGAAQWLSE
ncbi:hypothetical protein A7985_23035 [Pseudoalteromonas luteoviolacea]|uniref:STAS domain-containing protein n=1 Tax=Pseudoalteromonas luteoviolacea TaxID=43657 RepID=A0A1C0TK81_9GAMM|nr:hypothetical protein [Pseudoalteromonas luteoviolacea]MBQ4813900.1 hypothetical protein [Pseudoalteromonas luteoviolacea]OCQ18764.1 hypothetical protein A7985_23035 [Pseudoalteromonas luteoviolacea]